MAVAMSFIKLVCRSVDQQFSLVFGICLCTEDDHRDIPDFRQYVLSGKTGKHQIKQNKIGSMGFEKHQCFGTGAGMKNTLAFPGEQFLKQIADGNVVFNDSDGFHIMPF